MVSLDLTGRVAIITGAAQGLGEEMAMTMAEHGADVVIFDLEQQAQLLDAVVNNIREKTGRRVEGIFCDVTKEDQVENSVRYVLDHYGSINILVNNAGYIPYARPEAMPLTEWNKAIDTDLTGTFLMMKAVGNAYMIKHGGKIVNITSMSGLRAAAGSCVYAAAKAAVHNLSQSFAEAWARYGVFVNCIAPGSMINGGMNKTQTPETRARISAKVCQRRMGQYGDVSGVLMFLVSDACTYTQGEVITCDGGLILPAY